MIPTQEQVNDIVKEMTFDIKPWNTWVEFKWEWLTITCDLPLWEMQLNTALEKWNMERVAKWFWNLNQNKICTQK